MANQTNSHQGNSFGDFRFLPAPASPCSRYSLYPVPQLLENVSTLPVDIDEAVVAMLTIRWNS